jgi:hypothetical protein
LSDGSGCYEVAVTAKPPNLGSLKQELLRVASIADPTERLLEVAAVICEALSDLDVQPVVVGGLASRTGPTAISSSPATSTSSFRVYRNSRSG